MPSSTKKKKALNDMSDEELTELEGGSIIIMDYLSLQLHEIRSITQDRLEENLTK